jgi:hypothetical protein
MKRKSTSPCLLAIPAFDRIAGLYNRHLTRTGEYANANDFEARLRALTDLAKHQGLGGRMISFENAGVFIWEKVWSVSFT